MAAKIVIRKAMNGQFIFNCIAGNGEKILTREMYVAKASALNGIETVRKKAVVDPHFE